MHVSEVEGNFHFQIFAVQSLLDNRSERPDRTFLFKGELKKPNWSVLECEAWPPGRLAR